MRFRKNSLRETLKVCVKIVSKLTWCVSLTRMTWVRFSSWEIKKVFSLVWINYSRGFYSTLGQGTWGNLGRSTKGELICRFIRFWRFSRGGFCRRSPISTRRNGLLKLGKLLNVIGHIVSKTRLFLVPLVLFSGSSTLERPAFLLTHLVDLLKVCSMPAKVSNL